MHAKMCLFNYLWVNNKKTQYVGISKLCCAHCHLAWKTAGIEQIIEDNQTAVAGFHGNGYLWPLNNELITNAAFMKNFLGGDLYDEYEKIGDEKVTISTKKGKKQLGFEKKLAVETIQYICALNKGEYEYNDKDLIPGWQKKTGEIGRHK